MIAFLSAAGGVDVGAAGYLPGVIRSLFSVPLAASLATGSASLPPAVPLCLLLSLFQGERCDSRLYNQFQPDRHVALDLAAAMGFHSLGSS